MLVLAVVTFGIYGLYYWWVASREMDEYARRPGHSHKLIRIGTIVLLVAMAVLVFALISFFGTLIAASASGDEPTGGEVVAMVFGAFGVFFLAATAAFVGEVVRLVGKYRYWEMLEADERRRGHATPLSAGLMLILSLVGWFLPFIGWVLPLIVLYMTNEHTNQAWAAARA